MGIEGCDESDEHAARSTYGKDVVVEKEAAKEVDCDSQDLEEVEKEQCDRMATSRSTSSADIPTSSLLREHLVSSLTHLDCLNSSTTPPPLPALPPSILPIAFPDPVFPDGAEPRLRAAAFAVVPDCPRPRPSSMSVSASIGSDSRGVRGCSMLALSWCLGLHRGGR